jgi:hypothetical protein
MIRGAVCGRLGGDPVVRAMRTSATMVTASLAVDVGRGGDVYSRI